MIVAKHTAGVYVAGIDDSYSDSYTPYTIFTATGTGLGANFISFTGTGIYHNKFLIVDPSNACSDPMVLTGSHNWTVSADTKNDENTLIIHDDTIANIYYQSFHKDFIVNGGALTIPTGCPASVPLTNTIDEGVNIFPNPSTGEVHISGFCKQNEPIQVDIFNIIGQRIAVITNQQVIVNGIFNIYYTFKEKGMYLLKLKIGDQQLTKKVFITK